ncbi:MAG: type IV pilus secretin PilQ [Desulfobacterales bacterium]|nr:type IV pilus secretin PilQ [Desulfobacterales bacterium]MDX2513186.1 type IV pilus secretin PilQ [Desulfobacterales bacterium]
MADSRKNLFTQTAVILALIAWMMVLGACSAKQPSVSPDVVKPLELKAIQSISTVQEADQFKVEVGSNRLLTYTSVKKPSPLSVVLYFPETVIDGAATDIVIDSDVVSFVTASAISTEGQASRIEIGLKQDAPYEVIRGESGLSVVFNSIAGGKTLETAQIDTGIETTATAPAESQPVIVLASETTTADVQDTTASAADSSSTAKESADPAWINRIDFASEEAGKSTVIIGTTHPVTYSVKKKNDTWIQLRLNNTNLPDYRKHPLVTTRFESAVNRILPVQKPEMKTETLFSIELRESVPFFVEQNENFIMIHFQASSIPPQPLAEADLPPWKTIMAELAIVDEEQAASAEAQGMTQTAGMAPVVDAAVEVKNVSVATSRPQKTREYTGEKIALDFFETDIKNVFRILREISGKNFAIDKDVSGQVTLTLDKPVPWDQVLDLVLRMNQLGKVYDDDIIRIATLSTLKDEESLRAAKIMAAQKSLQQEKALEPVVTEYIAVNYSNAMTEILPHVKNILTPERGTVTVDARNNQIIITDTAEKIWQAKEIVNRIDKVTPQVVIEARIAEVNTDVASEFGFDWDVAIGPSNNDFLDGTLTGGMAMNFPAPTASSGVGFNFAKLSGTPFILNARLNALETNGEGKIISSPKIVTLDNKKARIKQGIEYPYLERDDTGGSSVSFKDIDLLLEVVPHVTPDNRVSMEIMITKNDISSITNGVPAISTNEAETELLVNDGDTIVIGGIMKTRKIAATRGFPWLSKIPVIGWFFGTKTDSSESSELLIFITPKIVKLEQRQML